MISIENACKISDFANLGEGYILNNTDKFGFIRTDALVLRLISLIKNPENFFSMAKQCIRQGKLHGKYRALQKDWRGGRNVPWLNVSGVWLEKAGFKVGHQIEITVTENQLVIKNCSCHADRSH